MSMAMKSNQPAAVMNGTCPVDLILAGVASFLIVYGLVMVGSASLEVGAKTYGNAFHLFNRHVMYLGVSLVAAALVLAMPISVWQRFDVLMLGASFCLLILVLVLCAATRNSTTILKNGARLILGLTVLQIGFGIATVVMHVPLGLASMHQAIAVALFATTLFVCHRAYRS